MSRQLSLVDATRIRINLVRVAWMAALLGMLMEALLLIGGDTTAALSSLLDNGLWPSLVCMAVSIGLSVSRGMPARAGLFAFVATPSAFLAAKVFQRAMATLTGGVSQGGFVTGPLLVEAGLRAVRICLGDAGAAFACGRNAGLKRDGPCVYAKSGAYRNRPFGLFVAEAPGD